MVILISKEGQLANRLWQAAHFISNAIENKYHLIHKGFGDYYEHFDESLNSLDRNYNVSFSEAKVFSFAQTAALKYVSLSNKLEARLKVKLPYIKKIYFLDYTPLRFYLSDKNFLKEAKKDIVVVDGWFYEDKPSLIRHAEIIRTIFKPNKVYQANVDKLCTEHFGNYDQVVGVHIRRGDYKTYNNGIWYYTDEDYVRFMKELLNEDLFKNKKVGFLICSNESINKDLFAEFNIIPATNQFIEDMYAFAKCNYIIGPPSTYSAWASFYGNVPVLHVYSKTSPVKGELFKAVDYAY